MTIIEAIEYLTPISESATLENYKEALSLALTALLNQTVSCCWCSPYLNGDLYLKNGDVDFQHITTNYCPSCGRRLD
jgi:hypothetical protein